MPLAVILCLLAYSSSYRRLAADAALEQASVAIQGRHCDHAEAAVRSAIEHAPQRLEGHLLLGRLHLQRGEYKQALAVLGRAMELGFDAEVYEWKAIALEKTGQRAAAIATLNELARLRPDLAGTRQPIVPVSEACGSHPCSGYGLR